MSRTNGENDAIHSVTNRTDGLRAEADDFVGDDEEILILELLESIVKHLFADWLYKRQQKATGQFYIYSKGSIFQLSNVGFLQITLEKSSIAWNITFAY